MNDVIKAMEERRSIRKYQAKPVPQEIIEQIVEAGTFAASGMGKQSALIIAVTDPALRSRLAKMNAEIGGWKPDFDPFYGAPAVLVVLADKKVPTYVYDGSLVMGNLMLAAHALDIGSCWIHRAKEEFESAEGQKILKDLGIEGEYGGIGHCVLGYVDGEYPATHPRKDNWVYYVK